MGVALFSGRSRPRVRVSRGRPVDRSSPRGSPARAGACRGTTGDGTAARRRPPRRHVEVDRVDDDAQHRVDDRSPSGTAGHEERLAVLRDDRRTHGAQHPLPRRDQVRRGADLARRRCSYAGQPIEIIHFVVEQKPAACGRRPGCRSCSRACTSGSAVPPASTTERCVVSFGSVAILMSPARSVLGVAFLSSMPAARFLRVRLVGELGHGISTNAGSPRYRARSPSGAARRLSHPVDRLHGPAAIFS